MATTGHFSTIAVLLLVCSLTILCLSFIPQASAADLGLAFYRCTREGELSMSSNTSSTLMSSTFEENLNSSLGNLTLLASQGTRYAIVSANSESLCFSTSTNLTSYGPHCDRSNISAPSSGALDIAYALFQCRGDQSSDGCATCVATAIATLTQSLCPSYVGAYIQLDGCYIRYDNQTFFTPDFALVKYLCYVETNDTAALLAIDYVVNDVTTQAPKNNGYASVSARNENALAQCLGYLTESECSQCLKSYNHSTGCNSDLGGQIHLVSCYYRYENYTFFTPSSGASSTPDLALGAPAPGSLGLPSPSNSSTGGLRKVAIIVVSVLVGAAVAVWCLVRIACKRRLQGTIAGSAGHQQSPPQLLQLLYTGAGLLRPNQTDFREPTLTAPGDNNSSQQLLKPKAKIFCLHDLKVATEHFQSSNLLGRGGFGPVYKGTLQNGEKIAVKKLSLGSEQGKQEFLNEVGLITSVQHRNLIRLLGCCVEDLERILVYEYAPNGSLNDLLFGVSTETTPLDWRTRHGIILGVARGLAYLHEESHIRIIHRDIKPGNILLNDRLEPVIGDFGLARLVLDSKTHISTGMAGTMGYIAPECGRVTEKVDVFSFGVVTLEIITGKRDQSDGIVEQIWKLYQDGRQMELVDPRLGNNFSPEEVKRTIHVALLCVQESSDKRPKMSSVRSLLSNNSNLIRIPTKPAL